MKLRRPIVNTKHKMAMAGSGMVAAGIGLSIIGAALIAPAVFSWAGRLIEKSADALSGELENASKRVGAVAGTLHRSFTEASRAGVAELRRSGLK
jgi:hypothetical protein